MQLGYIGLGKMGYNMVVRLVEKGHKVCAFDTDQDALGMAEVIGAKGASSISELVGGIETPRLIWIMVPHQVVDIVIKELTPHLSEGDTIIDGGNSMYKDTMRRAESLSAGGVHFLDAGVSGGPDGARNGACIMVGGDEKDYKKLEPLFKDLAAPHGYGYMGKHGAGHFVKMVHNGIEYGMMQALAEGFAVMKQSQFDLDLHAITDLYNHRSVVESRLVSWLQDAFEEFGEEMKGVSGSVEASGEGEWTVEAAKELGVPARVIEDALKFRVESAGLPSYTGKLLSAMRKQFGGHNVAS